jgi:hypothetical protein
VCVWEKDLKFVFLLLLCWGYIEAFIKILTIYHSQIHMLHHSPLSCLPRSWIVSIGLIFPFTYMCTHYLYHIHLPTPSPHWHTSSPLPPLVPTPQTGTVLPSFSVFI